MVAPRWSWPAWPQASAVSASRSASAHRGRWPHRGPPPPPAPVEEALDLEDIRDAASKRAQRRERPGVHRLSLPRLAHQRRALVQRLPRLAGRRARVLRLRRGQDGPRAALLVPGRTCGPGNSIWAPQYAALEIVGPAGDAVPGQSYHFDFAVDTFDPTSPYYPSGSRTSGSSRTSAARPRRSSTSAVTWRSGSPFTSPAGHIALRGRGGRPGRATSSTSASSGSSRASTCGARTPVRLAGKFLYAAYDAQTGVGTPRYALYGLAVQEKRRRLALAADQLLQQPGDRRRGALPEHGQVRRA